MARSGETIHEGTLTHCGFINFNQIYRSSTSSKYNADGKIELINAVFGDGNWA
jgi:hypothetical protein